MGVGVENFPRLSDLRRRTKNFFHGVQRILHFSRRKGTSERRSSRSHAPAQQSFAPGKRRRLNRFAVIHRALRVLLLEILYAVPSRKVVVNLRGLDGIFNLGGIATRRLNRYEHESSPDNARVLAIGGHVNCGGAHSQTAVNVTLHPDNALKRYEQWKRLRRA